jgi:hypothetical protein
VGGQYAFDVLPSAVGLVVGPELERAQVVRYRAIQPRLNARSVCPRLAAPRTGFSRSGSVGRGASLITAALTEGRLVRGRSEPSFAS